MNLFIGNDIPYLNFGIPHSGQSLGSKLSESESVLDPQIFFALMGLGIWNLINGGIIAKPAKKVRDET